ncbi:SDR family NAD(P)-dependent oxidoreductase [Streptomyces inhibens]|uniref:SDR family NAD(P)-dependent oxidoreductase n=1 Tax=Streptomyces inhibens TaxID=2293571 RepID=A0A371Q4G2_STRIH|nr:SDR family NAD(P)-dependent oxidoreductase [Streptomyces inhibens]REK89253.1 SDR family NAD(P)-dependent oxidoreductase [Streptomyces inhibens]
MDVSPQNAESESALVAVVTGAAQGIGRKVAEVLAAEGYALVLADIKEPGETLAAVRDTGAEATAAVGDITSEAYVTALADGVRERYGCADVLVNNAGVSPLTPAEDTTAAQWRRVLGFKLFYEEDAQGSRLMTPKEVLALRPQSEYVMYE